MSAHKGERAKAIHTALRVLLDPDHNCGQCWLCRAFLDACEGDKSEWCGNEYATKGSIVRREVS